MATRISSAASNAQMINILLRTQRRLHESEVQVATETVSQDYTGLSRESERLVGLETKRDQLKRYTQNNDTMQLRLNTSADAVDIIKETINGFRQDLANFDQGGLANEEEVGLLQDSAFRSMKALEAYLNSEADGTFLFAGTRNTTEPVDFGVTSLSSFQAKYDGSTITWPTTRDTALNLKLTATTGFPTNPTGAGVGNLTFANTNPDTITAATAGSFANIPVGATITISSATAAGNNGTFTVAANDGTTITLAAGDALVASAADAAAVLTADTSWYNGDANPVTHRVSDRQEFENTLNAADPGFEKAIRAMGLIAQGVFGTAGGLDQNTQRLDQAKYLIDAALYTTTSGTPPFGTEQTGSVEEASTKLGFDQVLVDRTNKSHKATIGLLELRVGDIENVDMLEAITRVTDDTRALEASYQTLARIRSLSLQDFLR